MGEHGEAFCRDCLSLVPLGARACPSCGSRRIVDHPELATLSIAHVDCDAFFAAIEKRDDPRLNDKPLIIGGGRRGVVSTACYIARRYGVHSAMPMFKALKACPQAVVIRPNIEKYSVVGRQVRALMLDLTPLVEPLSIDEAFLDLSGTQRLHKACPAHVLAGFARRVEHEIGISVSIGLAPNKFLAKIASDLDKPRGFSIIGAGQAQAFLADKPVTIIFGVGKSTAARLGSLGLRTLADIRRFDQSSMMRHFGKEGLRLHRLAHGIDERLVSPDRETKSISAETTFDQDIKRQEDILPVLLELSEKLAHRLRRTNFATRNVTLKLKTAQFALRTRSRGGLPATQLSNRIFDTARELLLPELDGTAFRLIGVGAHDLCPGEQADQGDLTDPDIGREVGVEKAIDSIRDRFGKGALLRGTVLAARDKPK
jgi:DNA polymerase IV